jgi:predicted acylesterase/phospholipase RssA
MKKKLKVALVIGGGVSLGAFNGGAIAEMLREGCRREAIRSRWRNRSDRTLHERAGAFLVTATAIGEGGCKRLRRRMDDAGGGNHKAVTTLSLDKETGHGRPQDASRLLGSHS